MSAPSPTILARVREFFRPPAKVTVPKVTASVRSSGADGRIRLDSSAILARYEAGWMGNGHDRSWLPHYVQDAKYDISPGERIEMVRKSRYFECNNATYQKILDLIETNVVGTGVHVTFNSSDAKWNARAQAWLARWRKFADLTSRQSFETLQALIVRAQAVDGEIFVWLTTGDLDAQGRTYPRIQLIETHRVCDAKLPAQYAAEGYTLYDGILTDGRGRPVFYIVTNDADAFSKTSPKNVALIPAEQMVHVYEPSRTSQPHGLPLGHGCLTVLHDLDDLQRYEMLSSKDASHRANVVYTENGEMPDDGSVIGRTEQVPGDNGEMVEKIVYYQTALGAKTTVMKHGDKWQQGEALRPTSAQQEFWKILERKVCRGMGPSYAALCDYEGNWSGPALRGALASDNRFYDVRTQTLVTSLQLVIEYVIGTQVKPGGDLAGAPADWRNTTWQSPRRATVDIGREAKAILADLEAGVRTERDVQGELGLDWNDVQTQRLLEIRKRLAAAQSLSTEFGIPLLNACAILGLNTGTVIRAQESAADPTADLSNTQAPAPDGAPTPPPQSRKKPSAAK